MIWSLFALTKLIGTRYAVTMEFISGHAPRVFFNSSMIPAYRLVTTPFDQARDGHRHVDEDCSSFHVQRQHFGQSDFQTYEGFKLLYEFGMQSYKSTKGVGYPFRQVTILRYCILEAYRNKI